MQRGRALNKLLRLSVLEGDHTEVVSLKAHDIDAAKAVLPLVPLLSMGAIPIAGILLIAAAGGSAWNAAAFLGLVSVLHGAVAVAARRAHPGRNRTLDFSARTLVSAAATLGVIWGLGARFNAGTPAQIALQLAALAAAGALSCWVAPHLSPLFRGAGASFLVPLIAGTATAWLVAPSSSLTGAAACVLALGGAAALYSRTLAKLFGRHLADKAELREQREIVRILLKEFEHHAKRLDLAFRRDRQHRQGQRSVRDGGEARAHDPARPGFLRVPALAQRRKRANRP